MLRRTGRTVRVGSAFSATAASLLPFTSFSTFFASDFTALSALATSFLASLLTLDVSFSNAVSAFWHLLLQLFQL